jgi:hypothetical protein
MFNKTVLLSMMAVACFTFAPDSMLLRGSMSDTFYDQSWGVAEDGT